MCNTVHWSFEKHWMNWQFLRTTQNSTVGIITNFISKLCTEVWSHGITCGSLTFHLCESEFCHLQQILLVVVPEAKKKINYFIYKQICLRVHSLPVSLSGSSYKGQEQLTKIYLGHSLTFTLRCTAGVGSHIHREHWHVFQVKIMKTILALSFSSDTGFPLPFLL